MKFRSYQNPARVKQATAALLAVALLAMQANAEPTPKNFRSILLEDHNRVRAEHGSASLKWNDALAKNAQKWAENLAKRDAFEHAPRKSGAKAQGENLWMGTVGSYATSEMVGFWTDERVNTVSGVFPDVSKTGDWTDVGHFTQMIWPSTRELGCALASNAENDVLVCRYYPAGNLIGDTITLKITK
jgi:hypothetical protein